MPAAAPDDSPEPAATPSQARWRRRIWPLAPLLLAVAGVGGIRIDTWDVPTLTLLVAVVLPLAAAVVIAGVSVGGRRGWVVGAVLTGFLAYSSWWFGWGLEEVIAPFSVGDAAVGLADLAVYELALTVALWPILLLLSILIALWARRRGRGAGAAIGVLWLVLVFLSFPREGGWSDSCNSQSGATPLITSPATQWLMDRGIGVLPNRSSTLMLCRTVGDREWKPFWLGDDDLPPKPRLFSGMFGALSVPQHLYRPPARLPGGRLGRVGIAYSPSLDDLFVVVVTDDRLGTAPDDGWPPVDLRIAGVAFDDSGVFGERGSRGWCYSAVWVRNPNLPRYRIGDRLRVDLVDGKRRLGSGASRVVEITDHDSATAFGARFGCRNAF